METQIKPKGLITLQEQIRQKKELAHQGINFEKTLVEVEISTLIRPPYSTREPVENGRNAILNSLKEYGFLGGIFIHRERNQVIDGWQRVELWKEELGKTTIPCYQLDCTEAQERKLHLSLNRHASVFDPSKFGIEFNSLNLKDFGMTEAELSIADPKVNVEKRKLPNPEATVTLVKVISKLSTDAFEGLKNLARREGKTLNEIIEGLILNAIKNDNN
jgi:hypothetical protein